MGEKGETILKAILDGGSKSTSKEIMNITGYTNESFHNVMRRLLQRGLVLQEKTKQPTKSGGWIVGMSSYTIKPQAMPKVLRLVKDRFGATYNNEI